jgi:tetratricopeptide (TPR) repeat protein
MAEAIEAMRSAAELSPRPYTLLSDLGYLYLKANQPQDALRAFQQAERSASPDIQAADNGTFAFMLAQGRSVAWHQLGHVAQAVAFQEKAAQLSNAPEPWRRLAKLYRQQGRAEDAIRAELMANASEQRQQEQ